MSDKLCVDICVRIMCGTVRLNVDSEYFFLIFEMLEIFFFRLYFKYEDIKLSSNNHSGCTYEYSTILTVCL